MSVQESNPTLAQPTDVALYTYLLRLADDNLILSQRLGELIAHMPELEEDIAVANVALDHLGQARNLYQYACQLQAPGSSPSEDDSSPSEDDLAMLRDERAFLNAVLVEQPNGDFANVMVRQLLVDSYQVPLYEALAAGTDQRLAGIAAKAAKEARYHRENSAAWIITLGNGTTESHRRTQDAIDHLWQFSDDLFAADEVEVELSARGVAPEPATIRSAFDATIDQVMTEANLRLPEDRYQRTGGRNGFHTAHLGHLLPEMQWLYRSHPGVSW